MIRAALARCSRALASLDLLRLSLRESTATPVPPTLPSVAPEPLPAPPSVPYVSSFDPALVGYEFDDPTDDDHITGVRFRGYRP